MGDVDKLERFPSSHVRQQVMGFGAFGSNAGGGHGWLCTGPMNTGSGMQRQDGGKSASPQCSQGLVLPAVYRQGESQSMS